jgi:hypothetical protein
VVGLGVGVGVGLVLDGGGLDVPDFVGDGFGADDDVGCGFGAELDEDGALVGCLLPLPADCLCLPG